MGFAKAPKGTFFRFQCVLPIPVTEYVRERDSRAFRQLAMKDLTLSRMEFLECRRESDDLYTARLVTKPDFSRYVPQSWVDWVVGDQLEFVDELQYDRALLTGPGKYTLLVKCVPPFLGKRADIECRLSFEDTGGGTTLQVLEGRVHIKVLGLGRVAEPLVVRGLQQAYADIPAMVQKWVDFREQALAEGRGQELLEGRPDIPYPAPTAAAAAAAAAAEPVFDTPSPAASFASADDGGADDDASPAAAAAGAAAVVVPSGDGGRRVAGGTAGSPVAPQGPPAAKLCTGGGGGGKCHADSASELAAGGNPMGDPALEHEGRGVAPLQASGGSA